MSDDLDNMRNSLIETIDLKPKFDKLNNEANHNLQ